MEKINTINIKGKIYTVDLASKTLFNTKNKKEKIKMDEDSFYYFRDLVSTPTH